MSAESTFRLKEVSFFHRQVMIVCQNENGPCPLLAIINILLLQGKIQISSDRRYISLDELIQLAIDAVFDSKDQLDSKSAEGGHELNQHMDDVLTVLPRLNNGMDLNIHFSNVHKYEFTQEAAIFDVLQISLVHGWLFDPKTEPEIASVLKDFSYNHAIYKLVEYHALKDKLITAYPDQSLDACIDLLTEEERNLLHDGALIDSFMSQHASQLTTYGIHKLYEYMNDRQLVVFFRNNHFSTLFSYNAQLFLLLTDLGYSDQPAVVWELLENVSGSTEFYNNEFVPLSSLPADTIQSPSSPDTTTAAPGSPIGSPATGGGTVCRPPAASAITSISMSSPSPNVSEAVNNQQRGNDDIVSPFHTASNAATTSTTSPPHTHSNNANNNNSNNPTIYSLADFQGAPVFHFPTTGTGREDEVLDADLLLALELQRQEDEEATAARIAQDATTEEDRDHHPQYRDTTSPPAAAAQFRQQQQQQFEEEDDAALGLGLDLGLSPEEIEQQRAMLAMYSQQQQQPSQGGTAGTAATPTTRSASAQQPNNSNNTTAPPRTTPVVPVAPATSTATATATATASPNKKTSSSCSIQ